MTLQLTPQQQNILDGNEGPARKLAMEILVKVGEGFGAQRLIPIQKCTFGIARIQERF